MADDLRVFFFPLMSPGHMIPMLDMAAIFADRGVWSTIVTTPGNEKVVRPTIERSLSTPRPIVLLLLPFPPSVRHLLPNGVENLASVCSSADFESIFTATVALRDPLQDLLLLHRPHCLVSDSAFSWTSDLGLPRIVFHGPGAFALCVTDAVERRSLHLGDSDSFVVDGLPHRIELTRAHLPETFLASFILEARREAEGKSIGVVVNSFRELEPDYAELYRRTASGGRAWFIGPVALCHRDDLGRAGRGRDPSRAADDGSEAWRSWLDVRPDGSVLYVCFGSLCSFGAQQLREIASGLEASGRLFVWVVRGAPDEWLPELEELKERVAARGLVLDKWAPQVPILSHAAVGGFVTHCGWNSTLEGVTAGVPMATWPIFYEQFINETLIVDVLEVGVRVKSGKGETVTAEEVAAAAAAVMEGGEAAEERRRRVRGYADAARVAMEEGGSSYNDVGRLMEYLVALQTEDRP